MSMQMICYQMNCNKNVVNKIRYLTAKQIYDIVIKKSTSLLNPIIIIESDEFPEFNYVFIDGLRRFYFVTEIITLNNNLWEIHLHCDVTIFILQNQVGFVIRQENDYNEMLVDNNRKFTKGYEIDEYSIPNDFFGIQESDTSPRWLLVGMGVEGE